MCRNIRSGAYHVYRIALPAQIIIDFHDHLGGFVPRVLYHINQILLFGVEK